MQKHRFSIPAVAAAALVVVGATPAINTNPIDPDHPQITQQQSAATIVVRNHNSLDIEVVAVTEAGRRYPLGAVNAGAGRAFSLPEALLEGQEQYRLKVYSIGRKMGATVTNHYLEAVKTQLLSPRSGDEIVLQVHSPLSSSFIDRGPVG